MRDPKRINEYCERLKVIWFSVPDWRFGQLISNAMTAFMNETKQDIFYPEDEEIISFMEKYVDLIPKTEELC